MVAILPFMQDDNVFGAEATHALSVAFDEVCAALGVPETSAREREVIATRIIDLARKGERNADLLRDHVLRDAGSFDGKRTEPVQTSRGLMVG